MIEQFSVRHWNAAERRDQEAVAALPERHTRETRLQRIQTHETRQPQKC
jgi:hypothetical protein